MNKKVGVVLAVALVLAAGGGYWYVSQNKMAGGPGYTSKVAPVPTASVDETGPAGGNVMEGEIREGEVKRVTVVGSNFKFSPNEIRVKKGETVGIRFKNEGTTQHSLVIDAYEVATNQINPGDEEEVEFTADREGTFEYYCSVGSHRSMGMVGKLIVE